MNKHFLKTSRRARYFTLGEFTDNTDEIWIVLHGYGQLAEYFIRNFDVLDDGKKVIIAPEALNRFYLSGTSGRVGATWMTKEERGMEIEDYLEYLDNVIQELKLSKSSLSDIRINILGFSQGAVTAYRWALHTKQFKINKLILWAGIFPPDMDTDFAVQSEKLKNTDTYIVYGDEDPYLKEEHLKLLDDFKKIKNEVKVLTFSGKHQIDKKILSSLA
jgi:predicted esterase